MIQKINNLFMKLKVYICMTLYNHNIAIECSAFKRLLIVFFTGLVKDDYDYIVENLSEAFELDTS